jgi:hypothetical protein
MTETLLKNNKTTPELSIARPGRKEKRKKRSHLVIGESALLIADYFDWVDSLKISR